MAQRKRRRMDAKTGAPVTPIEILRRKPDGVLEHRRGQFGQSLVVKQGDELFLVFCPGDVPLSNDKLSGVMSRIDMSDPLTLKGIYTQAMMCALVFEPKPRQAYVMGAGGGRLPMALLRSAAGVTVSGSELDPDVLDLSQLYFGFRPEARMRIACAEGRADLTAQPDGRFDHIYLDCFGPDGRIPQSLTTVEFFQICAGKLAPGGVACMNFLEADPSFPAQVDGFLEVFRDVWTFEFEGTQVLFGRQSGRADHPDLVEAARTLQKHVPFGFDLVGHVSSLRPVPVPVVRVLKPLLDGSDRG